MTKKKPATLIPQSVLTDMLGVGCNCATIFKAAANAFDIEFAQAEQRATDKAKGLGLSGFIPCELPDFKERPVFQPSCQFACPEGAELLASLQYHGTQQGIRQKVNGYVVSANNHLSEMLDKSQQS